MKIRIGDRIVGDRSPCLIIAEAGVNHNGSIELAKKLIDAAKEVGADVVKFQTFKADKEAIKTAQKAAYQRELTDAKESQYEMIKKLELPDEQTIALKGYADKIGIIFMSTPYELECVDLLCNLGVPALKVGSGEITNHCLLEHMAKTGLPIIFSTGMSTLEEVRTAYELIKKYNDKIVLLQCTSNYPAKIENANLRVMKTLAETFDCPIGFSDHTPGIVASVAAVAYGANVIEKHFTIDKNLPGPDHKASLNPQEFADMVMAIRFVEKHIKKQFDEEDYYSALQKSADAGIMTEKEAKLAETLLGSPDKKPTEEELNVRDAVRRSIVAVQQIRKGETIKREHLSFKKPGTGIPPFEIDSVVGKKAGRDISIDELLSWDMLE